MRKEGAANFGSNEASGSRYDLLRREDDVKDIVPKNEKIQRGKIYFNDLLHPY